jgi:signal transduction histidine kinase/CheY-like chemotaxis protein
LLRRQVQRLLEPYGLDRHPQMAPFLDAVDAAYRASDADRLMLERAMELSSKELLAAKHAAEVSAQAKSAFLATMSHELRTPLNAVLGAGSLLGHTQLSDEQAEYLDTMQAGGRFLLTLINDLLDLTKIEAGCLQIEEMAVDPRALVEDVVAMFETVAGQRRIGLLQCVDPAVPGLVCSDPLRLRQVLVNFVGNAVKFTHQGGVTATLGFTTGANGGRMLRFTVRDTGIGVPEETQARLFQPFVQADSTTTRNYGGTGLGLAISQQLAQLMGGSVSMCSAVGEGSAFWLDVPLREAAPRTADQQARAIDLDCVVVADDRAHAQDVVHRLHGLGLEASAASPAGIDAVAAQPTRAPRVWLVGTALHAADAELRQRLAGQAVLLLGGDGTAPGTPQVRLPCTQRTLLHELSKLAAATTPVRVPAGDERLVGRVLLAEDNPANQMVASRMLRKLGVEFDVVDNGLDAVIAAAARRYDLILMDCQMPHMDGYDATRQIRAQTPATARLPILAVTANTSPEDLARCRGAGMDDVLTKPFTADQLRAKIARLLTQTPV